MSPKKILFVFTSANKTLTGAPTVSPHINVDLTLKWWLNELHRQGWYLPEGAHPYYTLAPDYAIDFASPAGPNPPVDEGSVKVKLFPRL